MKSLLITVLMIFALPAAAQTCPAPGEPSPVHSVIRSGDHTIYNQLFYDDGVTTSYFIADSRNPEVTGDGICRLLGHKTTVSFGTTSLIVGPDRAGSTFLLGLDRAGEVIDTGATVHSKRYAVIWSAVCKD